MEENEQSEAKKARHIRQLFKRVFDHEEGEKVLGILEAHFDAHLPSMIAMNYDTHKAALMDGQKSVLLEIRDIIKGKYDIKPNNK